MTEPEPEPAPPALPVCPCCGHSAWRYDAPVPVCTTCNTAADNEPAGTCCGG